MKGAGLVAGAPGWYGPVKMDQFLRSFSGVRIRRVVDHSLAQVAEHAHDWPVLSLFVLGGYSNTTELGEARIDGPSAVLYRAGAPHSNRIGPAGFEQIEIEFDPDWLGRPLLPDAPVSRWLGGPAGEEAQGPLAAGLQAFDSVALRDRLRGFIRRASQQPVTSRAAWTCRVEQRLRDRPALRVRDLAAEAGLHPAWLGSAYRRATGESPSRAAARFRVEAAARLLRETDQPPAQIAAEAGFCDQSHMIRTFHRLLGRRPSAVRSDAAEMRQSL
ncbi:MAG: AraC family transcriptional regulator [Caulobacteraceae bacterium]|nr:MAG: AraC family transcriptional regulator [Caulobacteraceae bacterium]